MAAREPVAGQQTLQAGMWWVEMGSSFETELSMAGMLLAYDVQLRMDRATRASVGSGRRFGLQSGRIWVHSGVENKDLLVVGTPRGLVDVVGATDISFREGNLHVLSLAGHAVVHIEGEEPIRVPAGQRLSVADAGTTGPSVVAFLPAETSWMTRLLLYQQDRGELEKRIQELVAAFFGEEHREAAERELRRVGADAVPALIETFVATPGIESAFARKIGEMASGMASRTTMDHLFQLLSHREAQVRVDGFRGIYRISGDDYGKDAEYWRDEANRGAHPETIRAWWQKLR